MSWRTWLGKLKSNTILRAIGISILLHLMLFIVVEMGNAKGLWKAHILPKAAEMRPNMSELQKLLAQQKTNEPPVLHFVEVDPQQPVEEPKDTPYYSTANTQAANSDTRNDANKPKIEGAQENVLKTRDLVKGEAKPTPPPQPAPPKKQPTEMQPATKQTAAAEPPGDTKENTLKPEEKAQRDMTFDRPAPTRPRTLADARAAKGIIESPKTRQEGGVKKFAIESDLDVKASPFGSYDAAFIAAVQARWFALLEQRDYVFDKSGRVVVEFRLYKDGTIRQMNVPKNEVTETLAWCCQRAISDPAPYAPFPKDLQRLLKQDFRDVRFTFHYN